MSKSPISSPETWTYLYWSSTGNWGLGATTLGITWICDTGGFCTSAPTSGMNIFKANVFMNANTLTPASAFARQWTAAHEMGHAMGVFHHSSTSYLMNPSVGAVNGPAAGDIGAKPPCSGGSTAYGVRCIYNWNAD